MVKKIVCLGWGSLIWDPDTLPVDDGSWQCDGPQVRVEFVRLSNNGRLTLALYKKATKLVPSLWARMKVESLDEAVKALAWREGPPGKSLSNPERDIGRWPRDDGEPNIIDLGNWASQNNVDHVIWTALRPRFKNNGDAPTENEAVEYLRDLSGTEQANAKKYVRCAPKQINTAYRKRIIHDLGWAPAPDAECTD